MSTEPVPLLGGKSVYCINQGQLAEAFRLANEDPETSPRIQAKLAELRHEFSRNEQAALAFVMIDQLLQTAAN